jgi:hypothetical protein
LSDPLAAPVDPTTQKKRGLTDIQRREMDSCYYKNRTLLKQWVLDLTPLNAKSTWELVGPVCNEDNCYYSGALMGGIQLVGKEEEMLRLTVSRSTCQISVVSTRVSAVEAYRRLGQPSCPSIAKIRKTKPLQSRWLISSEVNGDLTVVVRPNGRSRLLSRTDSLENYFDAETPELDEWVTQLLQKSIRWRPLNREQPMVTWLNFRIVPHPDQPASVTLSTRCGTEIVDSWSFDATGKPTHVVQREK